MSELICVKVRGSLEDFLNDKLDSTIRGEMNNHLENCYPCGYELINLVVKLKHEQAPLETPSEMPSPMELYRRYIAAGEEG